MEIVLVGGGFVGMYAARRLERRLDPAHRITLVSDENYLTYQPFLPEIAAGSLEPRHVVVPLRQALRRTRVLVARVEEVDTGARCVRARTIAGDTVELGYDHLVLGTGSVSRVLPIPGLVQHAVGFQTLEQAIHFRNVVLGRLEAAAATSDPTERRALLTFVVVGGGYTGVEALAELSDLAADVIGLYRELALADTRWVLVEATGTLLPELDERLGRYCLANLRARGIDVRLHTTLESVESGVLRLSDGDRFPAHTLLWAAGVRARPLGERSALDTDRKGRLRTDEQLRVLDGGGEPVPGVWAGGDAAAVPDVTTGRECPPTAQHALRQAWCLGDNVAAAVKGEPLRRFEYRNRGQLVSLGRHKGVASVYGVRLRGFAAWFLHRTYHLLAMPTLNRRVRIALDWTVALAFPRDLTSIGTLSPPGDSLVRDPDLP